VKKLIVPDIHGEQSIVSKIKDCRIIEFEKIVFQGDYWDSFNIKFPEQLSTFKGILKLKENFPDKVVLLLGNHDIHYLTNKITYSGYQLEHAAAISAWMRDNLDKFQNSYFCKKTNQLHTHAGLSNSFYERLNLLKPRPEDVELEEWLNSFTIDQAHTLYHKDGYSPHNCISMIRPEGLLSDIYLGDNILMQVVGHTHSNRMRMCPNLLVVDSSHLMEINI